jgi:hypothetical protein
MTDDLEPEEIVVVDDDWPPELTEPTPSCLNCDDSGCADCRPYFVDGYDDLW